MTYYRRGVGDVWIGSDPLGNNWPPDNTPVFPLPPVPTPSPYYVVQRGDTLTSIATRFLVAPGDLAQANNLSNANQVRVGMVLYIPQLGGSSTAPATRPGTTTGDNNAPPPSADDWDATLKKYAPYALGAAFLLLFVLPSRHD